MKQVCTILTFTAFVPEDMSTEKFQELIVKRLSEKDGQSIRIWVEEYPDENLAEPLFQLTSVRVRELKD
jgi:hypothetical protein